MGYLFDTVTGEVVYVPEHEYNRIMKEQEPVGESIPRDENSAMHHISSSYIYPSRADTTFWGKKRVPTQSRIQLSTAEMRY